MTVAPSMKRSGSIDTNRRLEATDDDHRQDRLGQAGRQRAAGGRDPDRPEQQPRQDADDEQPERRDTGPASRRRVG